ncbi:hypothetical protein [Gimesia aquarii]|uniref:Uncharacterized protein n=1 Tax=Gimesia aquarii TaxID=2527964 RepID=A0A517WRT8_9PLAN|nr:hypothetical protein [Gimesia aquarii]QDU07975.1 hypothetical protein V202x_13370 [Gimesia aquarii]
MSLNERKYLLPVLTVVFLLSMFLVPLQGKDENERTREEWVKICEKKLKQVEAGMERWASAGIPPFKIRDIMLAEFIPNMKAGKYQEAEKVADRALKMLNKGLPVYKPRNLKKYLRKTKETQYIILPIREAGQLYGGQTDGLDNGIQQTIAKIGKATDPRQRNWGFHLIIHTWRFDPKHSVNKRADIARAVRGAFDVAIRNNVAVHFTIDSHEWENRPDLWNYADKEKPGYDPKNKANVEWIDWDGTPHPHRYRNWGVPEGMAPVICYNSPHVLREVSRMIGEVVAPPIKAGLDRLKKEGKEYLFSGVTVGAEPALPNYENVDRLRPQIAKLMDQNGSPKARLGFNALTNKGYSKTEPPKDFGRALAQINQEYTSFWSQKLAEAGIPIQKMYTHVAAGAGVVGSPQVEFTNAPLDIAFNHHSRPGWTTYPVGPFRNDFGLLYEELARHGNPHWASTEASPTMGPSGGKHSLSMKDYLARHFDYGATAIVFNTGATSKALSDSLTEGVWGKEALQAYREHLAPPSK